MNEDTIRIGDWLIEPARNRISRDSTEEHLERRAMDVLVHLARAAPGTVSADELLDLFWNGRIVESSTIHRTISRIRRALSDEPRSARYLETVPKRGYRVISAVEMISSTGKPSPAPANAKTEFVAARSASLVEESDVLNLGRVQVNYRSCRIGRGDDNDLVLADGSISNEHARLSLSKMDWVIEDLGSTNGICINGDYFDIATLHDGDLIELGRVKLRFEVD